MRPTILHVGGVLYWTIQTRNPDTMVLKDADSTPVVAVRKNGSSVADSVTVTKRSATTGLYDCSYNPASEVEGDSYQFEESASVTGTTTSSATYVNQFSVRVRSLERGTDGALRPTVAGHTLNVSVDGEGDAVLNSETQTQLDDIETSVNANTGYLTALTSAVSALATKVRKYFQLALRKDAAIATDNAAELTEINASGGSGVGSYLSTARSQQALGDSIIGTINSAIAIAGVPVTVTGVPSFLRVGDARTVANGGAIPVRLYSADDETLLFGLGTKLFEDATITFSLRRSGNDGTEGVEEAVIPCTWVESGGDGYVLISYEGDALDGCDAMDRVKEKDCHRWGIKFQWGTNDPITPVYGNVSVLRKIVSTQ